MITYTICFCLHQDTVLMLYRHRPPNERLWNGLGGKIEPGETPRAGIYREVAEEATIALDHAGDTRFAGVVTWPVRSHRDGSRRRDAPRQGMYAFVATLGRSYTPATDDRVIPEGILSWKPITWVCDPRNDLVVENIPHFLPAMLEDDEPKHYRCHYADDRLLGVDILPLEDELKI